VVDALWVSCGPGRATVETVLPNGRAQIVIDGDRGESLLVGPRTRPSVVRPPTFSAGVSLGGLGMPALSRAPTREVLDEVVDAGDVWAGAPWARCLDTVAPDEILDRLEHEALRHLRDERELDRQVRALERAIRGGTRYDEVLASIGADRRRLVPAFRDAVGLAPKRYARIVRFQRSLRVMRSATPPPLATIAATHGYADQAHLSREFREFSGLTPSQVHGAASTAHNHVRFERRAAPEGDGHSA
jgi:AraC-like DNA-binding protein